MRRTRGRYVRHHIGRAFLRLLLAFGIFGIRIQDPFPLCNWVADGLKPRRVSLVILEINTVGVNL